MRIFNHTGGLKLKKEAKEYFFRKKILNNYEIISEDESSFVLKTKISYYDEILNIVKQWIPYMQILKPKELKEKLHILLKDYLEDVTR